jgi:hypothetical protein
MVVAGQPLRGALVGHFEGTLIYTAATTEITATITAAANSALTIRGASGPVTYKAYRRFSHVMGSQEQS